MTSLNDEMADAQAQIDEIRDHLRTELPQLFEFDVTVGGVEYNANSNTITASVEPSVTARDQLSDRLGGGKVTIEDELTFQFQLASTDRDDAVGTAQRVTFISSPTRACWPTGTQVISVYGVGRLRVLPIASIGSTVWL